MIILWRSFCLTGHCMLHKGCLGCNADMTGSTMSCRAGTFCLWLGSLSPREVVTRPLLSAA